MRDGRPALSDAEKKRRGTFDPRYSEAERSGRSEAKVVSLFGQDALSVVPEPPRGLTQKALANYELWTRRLHEAGRLTQIWVDKITMYAVRRHSIEARLADGKSPKSDDIKACELFLRELGHLNVDQPRAGQDSTGKKFGRVGIATGRRL